MKLLFKFPFRLLIEDRNKADFLLIFHMQLC